MSIQTRQNQDHQKIKFMFVYIWGAKPFDL